MRQRLADSTVLHVTCILITAMSEGRVGTATVNVVASGNAHRDGDTTNGNNQRSGVRVTDGDGARSIRCDHLNTGDLEYQQRVDRRRLFEWNCFGIAAGNCDDYREVRLGDGNRGNYSEMSLNSFTASLQR